MNPIYNFSAGPAVLPKEVLKQARDEMLDWHGSGMSVMEMSHRGKEFMAIAEETEHDLRELAGIPQNYTVLFLQGGASSQFAMVPLNLLHDKKRPTISTPVNGQLKPLKKQRNTVPSMLPHHHRMLILPMSRHKTNGIWTLKLRIFTTPATKPSAVSNLIGFLKLMLILAFLW